MRSYSDVVSQYLGPVRQYLTRIDAYTELTVHERSEIVVSDRVLRVISLRSVSPVLKPYEIDHWRKKYRQSKYLILLDNVIIHGNWRRLYNDMYERILPSYYTRIYTPIVSFTPCRVFVIPSGTRVLQYIPFNHDTRKLYDILSVSTISIMKRDGSLFHRKERRDSCSRYTVSNSIDFSYEEVPRVLFPVSVSGICSMDNVYGCVEEGSSLYVRAHRIDYPVRVSYIDLFHQILQMVDVTFNTVPVQYRDVLVK